MCDDLGLDRRSEKAGNNLNKILTEDFPGWVGINGGAGPGGLIELSEVKLKSVRSEVQLFQLLLDILDFALLSMSHIV